MNVPTATPYSPLALSMGDCAGIGPEIIAKAFAQYPLVMQGCCVLGDAQVLARAAAQAAVQVPVVPVSEPKAALALPAGTLGVLPVAVAGVDAMQIALGQVSRSAGLLAAACVRTGAQLALRGHVAALVTAPLHKEALAAAGEPYPGHTELLQAEAAAFAGRTVAQLRVRMMLANPDLRVVLVSVHKPLQAAIAQLSTADIAATIHIADNALSKMLRRRPKLAVAGLNPHAGEGGLFGDEEARIIAPAIAAAQAAGVQVSGPYAPDTVFMRARRRADGTQAFDAVIALYHDQGLIPVKYLGVEHGVNTTLGLPFVRTSPDHGTAFDIAGTGQADCASLVAAVRSAKQAVGAAGA